MKQNNVLLWCNGKQQNETMMLKSNYDNDLAGVGGGAKVDAANGNIIICKHDSKLKHLQKICVYAFKMRKTPIASVVFLRKIGQTHLRTCSVLTECSFSECLKQV